MTRTDWNCNGRVDAGDGYIDYEIMNDKTGSGDGSGGDGESGCGCLCLIVIALIILLLF